LHDAAEPPLWTNNTPESTRKTERPSVMNIADH